MDRAKGDKISSLLIHVGGNPPALGALADRLAASGWRIDRLDGDPALAAHVGTALPAALLLGPDVEAGAWITAVRALPAPANGTPIILLGGLGGPDDPNPRPNSRLAADAEAETVLGALRHWAGPLADHDLRRAPFSPVYRLVRLMGLEQARALHARFIDGLATAVAEEENARPRAHGLAGSAGMMGHADLSAAWRLDGENALTRALALSETKLVELRGVQERLSAAD